MTLVRETNGSVRLRAVSVCAVLALLAGCSDDGGFDFARPAFDDLRVESDRLEDEIEDLDATRIEDLPTTGSASFEGVMVVETADDQTLAGEMDMEVDFGNERDPITGDVTNIVDSEDGRYGGSLGIDNSRLDGEVIPIFSADLGGTLVDPDGVELDVDADLDGTFLATEDDAISYAGGAVDGQSCAADDCVAFDGGFIVEQTGSSGLAVEGSETGAAIGSLVASGDAGDGSLIGSAPGVGPGEF